MDNDINIVEEKRKFFNRLQRKNKVNKSKIEDLDIESIGILLNYQQIDLMNYSWSDNIKYESYQNKLLPFNEYFCNKNERKRHLMILDDLRKDSKLPDKIRDVFDKIYDQTINNKNITDEVLTSTLDKLTTRLSTDLQYHIFKKKNELYRVSNMGIKDMKIDEARKLYSNVNNDFTSITIKDLCNYKNYVNYNGSYNREDLERVLKFCYDNDKQVRINDLISYDSFPLYLKEESKEVVKQKLLTYIDDLTRYIKNYNAIHTRIDRKCFIRSIDIISSLFTDDEPYTYRGNLNDPCESGFLSVLSLEDLLDVIKVARNNLPNVLFVYNENGLENDDKRKKVKEIVKAINEYEKKNNIKLIDTLGIKMHVSLDVLNDSLLAMFNDLSDLNLPIAITEFDLHATPDMLENNTSNEIEILRERFISDLCNIITNLQISKAIKFDSFTIDSVNDKQNEVLEIINKNREKQNLPQLLTIYGGYYDDNMDKKEVPDFGLKYSESGGIDFFYGAIIIVVLALIIAAVCFVFIKFI